MANTQTGLAPSREDFAAMLDASFGEADALEGVRGEEQSGCEGARLGSGDAHEVAQVDARAVLVRLEVDRDPVD